MNFTQKSIKPKADSLNQPDYYLFIFVSILIIISMLFSYSLPTYAVVFYEYNNLHFFIRQFFVGILSIFLMWGLSFLNPYKALKIIGMSSFILFFIVMIAMPFLPSGLVTESGGANRWIRLPGFSLSPVEFFKIGFIYFLAWSFSRRVYDQPTKMKWKDEMLLVLPYFGAFLAIVFIVAFMQKDLGQVVLMGIILFIMLMFANRSMKFFVSLGIVAIMGIVGLIMVAPHRISRIQSWWSMVQDTILFFLPSSVASELRIKEFPEPYQVSHSLNAISNGGFSGTGLGEGTIKLGFLSEVHTDFVLAGIAEETGFIGFTCIVLLVATVVVRVLKISRRSNNQIFHLFSLGVALMIIFAFLINAYGISGMIPIKGIAVPFLSYGGSALLSVSVAIGLVLSISRTVDLK
ncbi:MAG: FtsW/RodA/SpoVE family cell cycle protein [Arcobacteraceae bacterium]